MADDRRMTVEDFDRLWRRQTGRPLDSDTPLDALPQHAQNTPDTPDTPGDPGGPKTEPSWLRDMESLARSQREPETPETPETPEQQYAAFQKEVPPPRQSEPRPPMPGRATVAQPQAPQPHDPQPQPAPPSQPPPPEQADRATPAQRIRGRREDARAQREQARQQRADDRRLKVLKAARDEYAQTGQVTVRAARNPRDFGVHGPRERKVTPQKGEIEQLDRMIAQLEGDGGDTQGRGTGQASEQGQEKSPAATADNDRQDTAGSVDPGGRGGGVRLSSEERESLARVVADEVIKRLEQD